LTERTRQDHDGGFAGGQTETGWQFLRTTPAASPPMSVPVRRRHVMLPAESPVLRTL